MRQFMSEISEAELAFRLAKIGIGLSPPNGMSAETALAQLESTWPSDAGPFPFRTMARVAIKYFGECLGVLQEVS